MTAKIRLIETVLLGACDQRMVECALLPEGVSVTVSEIQDGFPPAGRTVRTMTWDQIEDLDFVSKLFDLETVRVFRTVAKLLSQAGNLRSCL